MINSPFKHAARYAQVARILMKYGQSDIVVESGLSAAIQSNETDDSASHDWESTDGKPDDGEPTPEDFAADLQSLGPTFIKLGQLLSTRPDFVAEPYRLALAKLQDDNDPLDLADVFKCIEQELGDQPDVLFKSFEVKPLATASLGQVHRAVMKDGRKVVVKILRPNIEQQLHDDIEAMEHLAGVCDKLGVGKAYQLTHLVKSLKYSLIQEIDYNNEASSGQRLAENLAEFQHIVIPKPILSHSAQRVLTMQYVPGEKITELSDARLSPQKASVLVNELFTCFLHQVLVHGSFHADPHPGNVLLGADDKIILLDHGLVVNVSPRLQSQLIKLLLAICEGKGSRAAELAEMSGVKGVDFDSAKFRMDIERVVSDNINQSVDKLETGAALMNIQKAAGNHDLELPMEIILLGRALMQLDEVVSCLDAEFNPNDKIRKEVAGIMSRHSGQKVTLSTLFQSLLETTEFAQELPSRANKFAELLASNDLKIKVDAVDENRLLAGLNKVANRISAGLIIAAMIIGAALMMRLETSWTILGYPAIAFCFMTFAALAGGILVWRVVISDNFK